MSSNRILDNISGFAGPQGVTGAIGPTGSIANISGLTGDTLRFYNNTWESTNILNIMDDVVNITTNSVNRLSINNTCSDLASPNGDFYFRAQNTRLDLIDDSNQTRVFADSNVTKLISPSGGGDTEVIVNDNGIKLTHGSNIGLEIGDTGCHMLSPNGTNVIEVNNNNLLFTGDPNGSITSGVWTSPSITLVQHLTTTSFNYGYYFRVGKIVHCGFKITAEPSNSSPKFSIVLPIERNSAFTSTSQAVGGFMPIDAGGGDTWVGGKIESINASTNQVLVSWNAPPFTDSVCTIHTTFDYYLE